jgi:hypothetical protein
MSGFGFGVFYVVDTQIKLIIMGFNFAAVFSATIRKHTYNAHIMSGKEG